MGGEPDQLKGTNKKWESTGARSPGVARPRREPSPCSAPAGGHERFKRLMLYSEAEFAFLFGRELLPRERRALCEALEVARQVAQKGRKKRRVLPVDIIEEVFGQPTAREMLGACPSNRNGLDFRDARSACLGSTGRFHAVACQNRTNVGALRLLGHAPRATRAPGNVGDAVRGGRCNTETTTVDTLAGLVNGFAERLARSRGGPARPLASAGLHLRRAEGVHERSPTWGSRCRACSSHECDVPNGDRAPRCCTERTRKRQAGSRSPPGYDRRLGPLGPLRPRSTLPW